jgi:putative tricarboxylic transport membrane protein
MYRAGKRLKERIPDLIGAGLLVALGIAFAVGATRFELIAEGGRIGPGLMPFVSGVLLVVFGVLVGVEAWWRRERTQEVVADEEAVSNRSVARAFALMLGAVLLVPIIGFLLSFGLLIFALVVLLEREPFWLGLVLSIGAIAVTWIVFVWFLRIPLPQGIFSG